MTAEASGKLQQQQQQPQPLFHRQIFDAAAQFGEDIALTDCETGDSLTFAGLRRQSIRLASALLALGIGRHSAAADQQQNVRTLLCLLPNSVQYPVILFAGALIGAPCSGASPDSSIDDLAQFVAKTDCQAMFASAGCSQLDWLAATAARRGIPLILLVNRAAAEENNGNGNKDNLAGLDFHRLLADHEGMGEEEVDAFLANTAPDTRLSLDHPFAAPLSSGASGVPKVVLQTHRNYIATTQILKDAVFDELTREGGGRRATIAAQPFCHASGLWILCYCLLTGHHSLVMPKFLPARFLELVKRHKIDTLSLGPWLMDLLMKQNLMSHNLTSVRTIISGGSSEATNAQKNGQFIAQFPALERFLIGYGMTEIVLISHMTPLQLGEPIADADRQKHLHSVGRLLPGFEHRIVDCVGGQDLTVLANAPGELWLHSACVMAGYLNDPEHTRRALDSDGWFHTGDIVYKDVDGFFFVVDRLSNLILVDGQHQVWPAKLESTLLAHPRVLEACVLGVEAEDHQHHLGEVPRAFVVLKKAAEDDDGLETLAEEEHQQQLLDQILLFANASLDAHQQIRGGILAVQSLPKTPFGKVAKYKVREAMLKSRGMEEDEQVGTQNSKIDGKAEEKKVRSGGFSENNEVKVNDKQKMRLGEKVEGDEKVEENFKKINSNEEKHEEDNEAEEEDNDEKTEEKINSEENREENHEEKHEENHEEDHEEAEADNVDDPEGKPVGDDNDDNDDGANENSKEFEEELVGPTEADVGDVKEEEVEAEIITICQMIAQEFEEFSEGGLLEMEEMTSKKEKNPKAVGKEEADDDKEQQEEEQEGEGEEDHEETVL